jgi:hypothetical protein
MISAKDALLYELEDELHDLCQPLTALNFRLTLGETAGDSEALREAIHGALEETARMIESLRRMRERVSAMKAAQRALDRTEISDEGMQLKSQAPGRVARS